MRTSLNMRLWRFRKKSLGHNALYNPYLPQNQHKRILGKIGRITLRTKIYTFIIILVMFATIQPNAHALDVFGFGIHDLYANITTNLLRTNAILQDAFNFAQTSPYDVVNGLAGSGQGRRLLLIRNAVIAMSITVATLLLMIDFFRKTINFEWSSKWENILVFLIKIIVVKQVVQNADIIVGHIFAGFNMINVAAIGSEIELLPVGNSATYRMTTFTWWENAGNTLLFGTRWFGNVFEGQSYSYYISMDAVRMFYPDATAPAGLNLDLDTNYFAIPTASFEFNPTIELMLLQPYFLVMHGVAIVVFVITIGRVFELALYTIFAPLPLSTFASEVSSDVGKNFIKNYIACVIQLAVIVVMFMVFVAMQRYFAAATDGAFETPLVRFVILIALGLSVVKSGAWAKKICGVG